jgi:hypothetical protein
MPWRLAKLEEAPARAALGGTGAGAVWLLSRALICSRSSQLVQPRASSAGCLLILEPFAPAAEAGSPCVIVNLQF